MSCFVLTLALASVAYAYDLPQVVGEFETGTTDGWQTNLWGGAQTLTPVNGGVNPLCPEDGEWQLAVGNFNNGWGPLAYLPIADAYTLKNFTGMTDIHLCMSIVKSEWNLGDFGWMNIVEDVVFQSDLNGWRQLGGAADCEQLVNGVWVPVLDVDPDTGEPGIKGRQSELWWDDPDQWIDGRHTMCLTLRFDSAGEIFTYGSGRPATWANILVIVMTSGAARGEDIAPVPMMGNF